MCFDLSCDIQIKQRERAFLVLSDNTSTILGGQSPGSVINSRKYVPVTAGARGDDQRSLDDAIRAALCGETRAAVVVGSEGSGKTTALRKLVADWAKGECLQNFSYVFNFQFREFGSSADELSLETLIHQGHHQTPPDFTRLVTEKPDGVLFVFDGLDEYKHSLDPSVHSLTSDLTRPASGSSLLASLLHGSLLKGAAFLVATRPTDNVRFLRGARVEVLGFRKPQREAYFNNFFTDSVAANRAFLHMERTLGFYEFCASPRFCWTVCSVYKWLLDSDAKLPETLSQLFADTLVHLIQTLSLNKACSRGLVLALGRVASHCLRGQHPSCPKHAVDAFGLQQFPTSVDSFLREHGEEELSFRSHLMREFVLAVAFFLDASAYEDAEKTLNDHKAGAKMLDLFMSGLSEPAQYRSLEDLLGTFSSGQIKAFKSWFRGRSEKALKDYNRSEHYRCFHLLHQAQNESLVKEILTPPAHPSIFHENLSLQDCAALNFVITCLGEREKLSVSRTTISRETMEILAPSVSLSHTVILSHCCIHKEALPLLASAVSTGVARDLDLSHSSIGDEKLQILCAGLRESKLHSLNLSVCGLTAACCGDLVSVLTSETSQLRNLQMMFNEIGDRGFTKLCEAMHSPNCRLQELQLFDSGLTGACCSDLKEVVMSEHCTLSELELSLNELGQEGALLLCQGLKRPSCPIETLGLTRCGLTPAVFEELASVLKNGTCRIKSLHLAINKVGDQGVKPLWDAVAHPSCLLEELNVEMTKLTDACVEDLCAALRANNTLRFLELRNNSLTDAAVPAIVQVMKEKHNMEELNLKYNNFSEDVFEMLEECHNIRY
uniref:NACHT, LRR and PYD domains-containing protein 12 n=1 Tax=Fundulus heteroclitus TaxID=8078 RepID=A0A3Q2NTB3_FUNHE